MIDWNHAYEIAGEIVDDLARDGVAISASQQEDIAHIVFYKVRRLRPTAPDAAGEVGRPPELGDTSICKHCRKPIEYIGPHWRHTTYNPRHPAQPLNANPPRR